MTCIVSLKAWLEIVQAAVTTVGIVLGGCWTYLLFVRQRIACPRATASLYLDSLLLDDHRRFVRVRFEITNPGQVMLRPPSAEVRLRQVLPLQDNVISAVPTTQDPVPPERNHI